MKKVLLMAMSAWASMICFSSCTEDNGNVWTEEDAVTRNVNSLTDAFSLLDNGLFSMVYPKEWECEVEEKEPGMKLIKLGGEGITMETVIIPAGLLYSVIEELVLDKESTDKASFIKKSINIDGIEGLVFTKENLDNKENLYWFRNGNKTIGIFIRQDMGHLNDYCLEECLRWKAGSNSNSNWLDEVKELTNLFNTSFQKEGKKNDFIKIVPEESLFIIQSVSYREYESRENAKHKLIRLVNALQEMKNCAEHSYTFQLDSANEDGEILYSFTFTPEDYRIDQNEVIVD